MTMLRLFHDQLAEGHKIRTIHAVSIHAGRQAFQGQFSLTFEAQQPYGPAFFIEQAETAQAFHPGLMQAAAAAAAVLAILLGLAARAVCLVAVAVVLRVAGLRLLAVLAASF